MRRLPGGSAHSQLPTLGKLIPAALRRRIGRLGARHNAGELVWVNSCTVHPFLTHLSPGHGRRAASVQASSVIRLDKARVILRPEWFHPSQLHNRIRSPRTGFRGPIAFKPRPLPRNPVEKQMGVAFPI
jgi:hypothetical protein